MWTCEDCGYTEDREVSRCANCDSYELKEPD